jgi:hypothetical protein
MSRVWSRWLARAGGLVLLGCAGSFEPPPAYVQVPVRLAFTVQPGDTTAGAPFGPVITVAIQDSFGLTVTAATSVVTLTLDQRAAGDTLLGGTRVAAVAGVATFPDLHIDRAGATYTLQAAATGLSSARSRTFAIAAGPAAQLAFAVQPSPTMSGGIITPAVQVTAQDPYGNLATGFQGDVTLALGDNPGAGTLSGTTVARAIGGVATFGDLSIDRLSGGYTLKASGGGLPATSSAPFAISDATTSLTITALTTGGAVAPHTYSVCIDPTPDGGDGVTCATSGTIGVSDSMAVTVDTGAHAVLLQGVTASCGVGGDNPRSVHAAPGQALTVVFIVTCGSGILHVTTTTTGASPAGDGYEVCIDNSYDYGCQYAWAIGANDTLTEYLPTGAHTVELDGLGANCMVAGDNPRTVELGAAVAVSFAITCVAAETGQP